MESGTDTELRPITRNGCNGASYSDQPVTLGNGDVVAYTTSEPTETDGLLPERVTLVNGDVVAYTTSEPTETDGLLPERVTLGNGDVVAYTTSEPTETDGLLPERVTLGNGDVVAYTTLEPMETDGLLPERVTLGNGDVVAYTTSEPMETDGLLPERVTLGNGDVVAYTTSEPTETDGLLPERATGSNGETKLSIHAAEAQTDHQEMSFPRRIKGQMTEIVFWRVRLWMVIVFILLLIVAVILISIAVCSAIHEDPDEEFDPSLFKVPRYFNGSFQLPNLVFTEELVNLSSNKSQTLTSDLREKLTQIYRSSPALGRYFSKAEIHALRNGSVIADYQLTFVMPEEQEDQLRNFTLSREMVYNVFRQSLYDQKPGDLGQTYIDPSSLNMF